MSSHQEAMLWQAYYSLNVSIINVKTEIELIENQLVEDEESTMWDFSGTDIKTKLQYWKSLLERYQTLQEEYLQELQSVNSVNL